ncbi:MAG: alcohol dehydrogenase catalytic domain-containing protein [Silicimonas sp.]|nr:alcohol dehydrogenase catalytic domain-containing protein [Silicimonas sp.]
MEALVYTGPESLEYRATADPVAGSGEVLIDIEAVGICGSDMHAYLGHDDRRPAPLILGHEACGVIRTGARAGSRVTINPLVPCGTCPACKSGRENICPERQIISMPPREGAFAQAIAMPEANLVTVPEGVAPEKAALAEPLACGWHAARLGIEALKAPPARTLVIGGGAIGLGAALCTRAQGAQGIRIVEPHMGRLRVLRAEGFEAMAPDALNGEAFDLVIDGVGYSATRAMATKYAAPGGVIAHIGLGEALGGLDIRRMTLQEITFIGTYTYTAQDFRDTAAAIFDGRLGDLNWTEPRALADGARAFADIQAGRVDAPKIMLYPEGAPT